jgi:two-component system chemotaxis sensor kinase CheA
MHRDLKDRGLTPLDFLDRVDSVGLCLEGYLDIEPITGLDDCLDHDFSFVFLFGSVLEHDLAVLALEIPEDQLQDLDAAAIRKSFTTERKPDPEEAPAPQPPTPPVEECPAAGTAASERRAGQEGTETLRVRVDLLNGLMNLAGELVLGRNQLLRTLGPVAGEVQGLAGVLQNINQVTSELQEGIMQTRMQPIGTLFNRFPRIVRDIARSLGKEIEVEIDGAEVELDKSIVELLSDPLTHIIRNCADHAIEPAEERVRLGKPRAGRVRLHAYHEGGQVNIAISDDGRGIDAGKVKAKALERGLITPTQAAAMNERELVYLIFAPGFSTASTVTDVSGRGVGMDVVRTNTEKLGGHVNVETQEGMGTTILLRLPLTLAIIPSMVVRVSKQRFAIPQVNVVEFVWIKAADVAKRIGEVQGAPVLRLRGRLLPLVRLTDVLGIKRTFIADPDGLECDDRRQNISDRRGEDAPPRETESDLEERRRPDRRNDWRTDYNIVVLKVGPNQFGIIVDELQDTEEIVVKPLSSFLEQCNCFSGATILGDGRVIMILDAGGMAERARLRFADIQAEEKRRVEEERRHEALAASQRRAIVLVEGYPGEYFAVAQDRVLRLERAPLSAIGTMANREYIDYRGQGLPLLRLDQHLPVRPLPETSDELYLIIPKSSRQGDRAAGGILISSIVDAVDVEVKLETGSVTGPGVLGSAIVHDHLTLFIEPDALLAAAGLAGEPA